MKKVLAILSLALLLSGCSGGSFLKNSYCGNNALRQGKRWQAEGYLIRYGHRESKTKGLNDRGHMWCEYYKNGRWYIADDTARQMSNRIADWYGYPNKKEEKEDEKVHVVRVDYACDFGECPGK